MKKVEMLINFFYRMIYGTICTYFVNQLVQMLGGDVQVGLNGWTIVVLGGFGIPGVVLLFGLMILRNL